MAFNYELAQKVLDLGDRDTALFFAGRDEEIRRFESALRASSLKEEAVFRIYQGAPGCGKTSLLAHLRGQPPDGVLFVRVEEKHLAGSDALKARIEKVALEDGPFYARIGSEAAKAIGEGLRLKGAGERLDAFIGAMIAKRVKTVVVHMDEAQLIGPPEQPGLLALHRDGLGIPTVCLLAGLSHTARNLGEIGGISRLASDAIVNMGAMADDECVESTRMMLDKLGVDGTDAEKSRTTEMVAALSGGWPHHLCGAQRALGKDLIRVNGVLKAVNTQRVKSESEQNRHSYYRSRLDHPVLAEHPPLTAAIIEHVNDRRPTSMLALKRLCEQILGETTGLAAPSRYADALIERGAVSITIGGGCEIPIPSMADWAASQADDDSR